MQTIFWSVLGLESEKIQVFQISEVIKDSGTIILLTRISLIFMNAPILLSLKKNQIFFGVFMVLGWKCTEKWIHTKDLKFYLTSTKNMENKYSPWHLTLMVILKKQVILNKKYMKFMEASIIYNVIDVWS